MNSVVARAVATILGAAAVQGALAQDRAQPASANAEPVGLEEVTVTATHRAETLQNVPITIQALTGETLTKLNVQTFNDFVKFLPNVTYNGAAPGQQSVYMRGLSTGAAAGGTTAGTTGPFPNVAAYLDEQSGQMPGRNLDVYAVDLERIEVLEGPQGTLFGAGAEAGVIRYITNKPKLGVFEGSVNAGYGITAGGGPSTNVDATFNFPLIQDKLAFRMSVYNDRRGGYIDNPLTVFERKPTDAGIVAYFGGVVPPNTGPVTNAGMPRDRINPVTYQGVRASALWQINDNWDARLTQSYQDMDAEGVFSQEVRDAAGNPLPERSAYEFGANENRDKFSNTALVVTGQMHDWQLVYAGSYLDRNVHQTGSFVENARSSTYTTYYQCAFPGYPFIGGNPTLVGGQKTPGYCWSPLSYLDIRTRATHQSHEMRLTSPAENRIRGLAGLFWERFELFNTEEYGYGGAPIFQPIGPPTIDPYTTPATTLPASCNNCDVRPYQDAFTNDVKRGYNQKAAFLSVDFDLIPKVLTLTGGLRWYDTENFERGYNVGSFGCEIYGPYFGGRNPPSPCVSTVATGVLSNLNNLDAKNLNEEYKGFLYRGNLTWHVTPDALLYYTYSEGYRPGGFNRAAPILRPTSPLYGLYSPPLAFGPDFLVNHEVGWKTQWLNRRVQINGSIYQESWKDVQLNIFQPEVTGNLAFNTNGPTYRVRGLETQVMTRIFGGLTLDVSASYNKSELVKNLQILNPATGQPIRILTNPYGSLGSPLAQAPLFQGSARLRYEVQLGEYDAFAQVGFSYRGSSFNSTDRTNAMNPPIELPGYGTCDLTLGAGRDRWVGQFVVTNLTDRIGIFDASRTANGLGLNQTIIPPRTLTARVSYKF